MRFRHNRGTKQSIGAVSIKSYGEIAYYSSAPGPHALPVRASFAPSRRPHSDPDERALIAALAAYHALVDRSPVLPIRKHYDRRSRPRVGHHEVLEAEVVPPMPQLRRSTLSL